MLTAGCTCPVSGACLSVKHEALVLTAAQHTRKLWFNELSPHGVQAGLEYWYYVACEFVSSRFDFAPMNYVFPFQSKDQLTAVSTVKRKGFTCHFRSNHTWEPEITNWMEPLELVDGYQRWTLRNRSVIMPKEITMMLTTNMLTATGFTSIPLGDKTLQTPERQEVKPRGKPYSVAISGGGWRALAGHMGAFRALSNKNALGMVDMLSSVSGGTWFLTKLAFDAKFSRKVLHNETDIGEVVMEWMESDYYSVIRNTTCSSKQNPKPDNTVGPAISASILQAPGVVRSYLGAVIVAANDFEFSWQKLVEQGVLGQDIADQPLSNVSLAPEARTKFGEAILAFNWNQLHHWNDQSACLKWFLRNQAGGEYVQYPVYTSAWYKQVSDTDVEVEVKMQGRPMEGLFNVCHAEKLDFCPQPSTTDENIQFWKGIASSFWAQPTAPLPNASQCANFNLNSLTVGQVASASSAFAGGAAVQTWVQNVITLVRKTTRDIPMRCTVLPMLIKQLLSPCNLEAVKEEIMTFLGCKSLSIWEKVFSSWEKHSIAVIAKKWSAFLQKMAIQMTVDTPLGKNAGHMAIDAVRPPCRYAHSKDT